MDDLEEWERQQLMIHGSDMLGKLYVPQVLPINQY